METTLFVGSVLILAGATVYVFRERVFWLLLFGMFEKNDLSSVGHSIFKAIGVLLLLDGLLILSL